LASASQLLEPLLFFAAVIASIWLFWNLLPVAISALVVWVLLSWAIHRHNAASLGFSLRTTVRCFARWKLMWLALVTVAWLVGIEPISKDVIFRAAKYLLWCTIQQAVYQSMIFGPLRSAFRRESTAALVSGVLFALVHLPNPVLVPATLLWGICSSLLFSRCASIPPLAGAQVLLSAIGYAVFPVSLHHGFRIGPAY
jgi:hypothetical protein